LLHHLQDRQIGEVAIDQVTPDYDEIFVQIMRTNDQASCAVPA